MWTKQHIKVGGGEPDSENTNTTHIVLACDNSWLTTIVLYVSMSCEKLWTSFDSEFEAIS